MLGCLAVILALTIVAFIMNSTQLQMHKGSKLLIEIASITLSALQILALYDKLTLDWPNPFSGCWKVISALNLNVEIFRTDCLSEDPGPHAVFFSWVRWEGAAGISRVTVVVVGSQKYSKNPRILVFDGVGHGF